MSSQTPFTINSPAELHRSWNTLHPLDSPSAIEIEIASTAATYELSRQGKRGIRITGALLKEFPKDSVIEAIKFPGGPIKLGAAPIKRHMEVIAIDAYEARSWEVLVTLPPSSTRPKWPTSICCPSMFNRL